MMGLNKANSSRTNDDPGRLHPAMVEVLTISTKRKWKPTADVPSATQPKKQKIPGKSQLQEPHSQRRLDVKYLAKSTTVYHSSSIRR